MEILFVVDKLEDIEKKISLLDSFGADIKFFVNSKHVAKLVKNKYILERIVAIYNKNVDITIDKYLKADEYKPTETLLYYSSAKLTAEMVDMIRENLKLNPDTIYIKKKFSIWDKVKLWFYHKFIKLIFGINDEYASVKLQYFSTNIMGALAETNFRNHIFQVSNSLNIEIPKGEEKTFYDNYKFNKNCLYNLIAICVILICYVVLERFLVLPFWVYLLVIALILATIINLIIFITVGAFDCRYKK